VNNSSMRFSLLTLTIVGVAVGCGGSDQVNGSSNSDQFAFDAAAFGPGSSSGSNGLGTGGSSNVPPGGGPNCNNGALDPGEQCDGALLGGSTCSSATMGSMPNGTLSCVNCALVVTGCSTNGVPPGTGGGNNGTGGGNGTGGRRGGAGGGP
jgi:hypothetical protein